MFTGRILFLLIHSKTASQCKMQMSEYILFIGNIVGFLVISVLYVIRYKL